MGLLDGLLGDSFDDPRTQAMLALSAGLLSQNGSKGLSAGLLGAGSAFQGARDAASARALKKAQADELMSQIEERKARTAQAEAQAREAARIQGVLPTLMRQPGLSGGEAQPQSVGGVPFFSKPMGAAPMQETPGGLDIRRAIQERVPLDTIEKLKKLDDVPNDIRPDKFTPESIRRFQMTRNPADLAPRDKMELSPGGQAYNPYALRPGQTMADPNKPFSMGADGTPAPNSAFQQYELNKSRAGAPTTNVKVENKMGEGVAAQVGPMVKAGYDAAQGALGQADAADRIATAIASNKLFTGPTANVQMFGARLAQALGVGGKDDAERIANTQQTIRGLAEFSLNARKALAGQGQITESEQKLLDRAVSGDITLTGAEIQIIANLTRRQAQKTYNLHQENVKRLKANPNTAGLAEFYTLPDMPASGGNEWSVQKVQ